MQLVKGEKTDDDIVSCYLCIIINLSTASYLQRYGLHSYLFRTKISLHLQISCTKQQH